MFSLAGIGRLRWLSSIAALGAAAAVGVSGCGASSVVDPVAKAASRSTAAPGYRLSMLMQLDSSALPVPITATGAGAFDVKDKSGSMTVDMRLPDVPQVRRELGSSTLKMREIIAQHTIYIGFPARLTARIPGHRPWLKVNLDQQAAAMGMSGVSALPTTPMASDPSQYLQYLRAVSNSVNRVGTATVAGHPTTEYRATIQLDREVQLAPARDRAAVRRAMSQLESLLHAKQLPVAVWIDNSHLVRRMVMHETMTLPTGPTMTMAMQVTIPEYGPQPMPAVPPAGQVTDAAQLRSGATPTA